MRVLQEPAKISSAKRARHPSSARLGMGSPGSHLVAGLILCAVFLGVGQCVISRFEKRSNSGAPAAVEPAPRVAAQKHPHPPSLGETLELTGKIAGTFIVGLATVYGGLLAFAAVCETASYAGRKLRGIPTNHEEYEKWQQAKRLEKEEKSLAELRENLKKAPPPREWHRPTDQTPPPPVV